MDLLPNLVTLTRLLAGIVLFVLCPDGRILLGLLIWGALSDWLDGVLARRLNATTRFGAAFDLFADAVFLTAAWFTLWRIDLLPLWCFTVIFLLTTVKWLALGIQVKSGRGVWSTGRIWNRALGICSYGLLVGVAAGLPWLPFVLVLLPVQIWAHGMDLREAIAGSRGV